MNENRSETGDERELTEQELLRYQVLQEEIHTLLASLLEDQNTPRHFKRSISPDSE